MRQCWTPSEIKPAVGGPVCLLLVLAALCEGALGERSRRVPVPHSRCIVWTHFENRHRLGAIG